MSGRAADVSAADAAHFGVTTELTSMTPYDIPQAWARLLRNEGGFDAVRYTPRFTPGASTALGMFGQAVPGVVGAEVRRVKGADALREAGIIVLSVPASTSLTVI